MANKLFETNPELQATSVVSKVRVNRDYLISNRTAEELNTYKSFEPFHTFADIYPKSYSEPNGDETTDQNMPIKYPGVRSLFNKAGAVLIGGVVSQSKYNPALEKASEWRISNNVPLMDNRVTRQAIRNDSGCTVKELVEASQKGLLGREIYSFSDFMFCKYLGRVSNNYMVTLRRFPYPVDDYISSIGIKENRGSKEYQTTNADSMGCLVTWMGTPGNDMANILKYVVNMPFKEQKAQIHQGGVDADAGGGPANAIAAAFDPTYRSQYASGMAGGAIQPYVNKMFPGMTAPNPYTVSQFSSFSDSTKAYGPVDTIKTTYTRSEDGLTFDQNITLVFDYELRAYNGINPRQAMLDLLSNILNVTFSTGTFWGGGYRGGGAHQNNIFANLKVFKCRGGFTDFIDAFAEDFSTITKKANNSIESNGGILETIKKLANSIGGMLIGGMLNRMGRPQKAMANSLLSPAPIGFWHVTVGNPHHPIMSIGNMILKNTTIEHYGPLGLDDFPTGLKVTCELTRGKSRDIRDIEKLYMHGNDRIYTPMGPKIFDMYKHSKEYRTKYDSKVTNIPGDADASVKVAGSTIEISDINGMKHVLLKYFGHADTESISIAAMEQDMGAHKKKKKGTAGGDSSAQGNKK